MAQVVLPPQVTEVVAAVPTEPVPLPTRTLAPVKVVLPVPPLATGRIPVTWVVRVTLPGILSILKQLPFMAKQPVLIFIPP